MKEKVVIFRETQCSHTLCIWFLSPPLNGARMVDEHANASEKFERIPAQEPFVDPAVFLHGSIVARGARAVKRFSAVCAAGVDIFRRFLYTVGESQERAER